MTPTTEAPSPTKVTEHAIHGLFHLDLDIGAVNSIETRLLACAEQAKGLQADDLVERLGLSNPHPLGSQAIWESTGGKGMALDDFYPYARQILGGKAEDATVCINLTLSSPGTQTLAQVKGGKHRYWRLRLGKTAHARCGTETIDLRFGNARLFLFRTGVVILDLCWHYRGDEAGLPESIVIEGNYMLTHGNHPPKNKNMALDSTADDCAPMDAQRLFDIAQALLPTEWTRNSPLQASRLALYSVVRLEDDASEPALLALGVRLSHRQTTDYDPRLQLLEANVLQPFPYLAHCLAPEGAASVVVNRPAASSFVTGFVQDKGANTYVPLFVASLHSHLWLLSQTEWLPARREGGKSQDRRHEIHDLEEVYERTVEFRRFFYFPMVSQISQHNAFYARCQEVFKVTERQRFLEQTTHDIAELLKARRTKWIGRVSGAVAGFLVGHEVLDAVSLAGFPGTIPNLRVWMVETAHASPAELDAMIRLVEHWDLIVFFGSVLAALLGLWAAWYFDRAPKGE